MILMSVIMYLNFNRVNSNGKYKSTSHISGSKIFEIEVGLVRNLTIHLKVELKWMELFEIHKRWNQFISYNGNTSAY